MPKSRARPTEKARKSTVASPPPFIAPQLSQLVTRPPSGAGWCHELKLDGYRLRARIAGGEVQLLTRTGLDWTHKYAATAHALAVLKVKSAYIDGELCALRPDGTASFSDLQAAIDRKRTDDLVFFAFDLLFLDGRDLTVAPLKERKRLLAKLLVKAPPAIQCMTHVAASDGAAFYKQPPARSPRSRASSASNSARPISRASAALGARSNASTRMSSSSSASQIPEGRRPYLGALLLGYYTPDGKLIYAGRAGTGMDERELKRLHSKLTPLETKTMTVSEAPPRTNRFGSPLKLSEVHWVKPKLVAQVRYLTWTAGGLLRQVVYLGLREDRPARQVVRERPT